ncbi:MAG: sulfite exporter TauE/SafE family protein [Pigmentiphaga sp.]|nr:sulfite exporter TauE/SafE family protein [Pigmentiphaga sp.]
MLTVYGVVTLGALVAGVIQGMSGFAFGVIAMSFWAWVLEPQMAATLTVFGALLGQVLGVMTVRRRFEWTLLAPFLAGGLIGLPLGVALLPRLDVNTFKFILGTILIFWCSAMLFSSRFSRIKRGGKWADGLIGMTGGVLGGLGGFSGIVPTLWCTLRGLPKDQQRAVIQNFNLFILAITFGAYLATGLVELAMLPMFGIVTVAMLIPVWLGARLYHAMSEVRFRQIVLSLLIVSGLSLLAASAPALLGR